MLEETEVEVMDFSVLKMKVPENVKNYSIEKQREIFDYLSELDDHHIKAYNIAFDHLRSSFDILRSNGFKEWIKAKAIEKSK
jgi:hypothetical protein